MRIRNNRLYTMILAAATLPLMARAVDTGDFHWQGKLKPGAAVEIKGVNGAITASLASGNEVEVSARKTARRSDPNGVRVELIEHADGITICALYPDVNGQPNECKPGSAGRNNSRNNDVKVDFTVKVPAGVRFVGRTVNGSIEALSLKSDVEANTVNGNVKVNTTGTAQVARTVNGSIEANSGAANWTGPAEFSSVNGSVRVGLPSSASADIRASTVNGSINTDFPLQVQGKFVGRRIDGKLGSGGRELKINTVNGSIHLRRLG